MEFYDISCRLLHGRIQSMREHRDDLSSPSSRFHTILHFACHFYIRITFRRTTASFFDECMKIYICWLAFSSEVVCVVIQIDLFLLLENLLSTYGTYRFISFYINLNANQNRLESLNRNRLKSKPCDKLT